ncbi:MAG: alkaline phosphatase [Bacteroidetes bacterium QH_2_64_26]|nr:MAG: alkaline phosphatase [Bacteroidetes bacterium QH_2_64_26]
MGGHFGVVLGSSYPVIAFCEPISTRSVSDSYHDRSSTTRRDFLKTGALGALALGTGGMAGTANGQSRTGVSDIDAPGDAKNVIFLVSDGMSAGTLTMADLHLRRHHGRRSNWIRLYDEGRVRRGLMDMAAANSVVTGSAAAASSWGSGHRVFNETLNMSQEGETYRTILEIFRDAGRGTGLVTTTRITHATPAGFGINMPKRWSEDEIAAQYLEREYDVLMGGGARHFDPDQRGDGKNLYQGFEDNGYTVARSRQALNYWGHEGSILGTFYDTHLPYVLDHQNISAQQEQVPRLPAMTDAALQRLDQNEDGFLLQIEGGRVDHAAHEDDTGGLIYDQIEFDEAIGRVLDFVEGRDDTLVIITTDHGNANPGVNAAGDQYGDSNPMFDRIADFRYTNSWILSELDENSTYRQIQDRVEEAWQFSIRRDEAEMIQDALREEYQAAYRKKSRPDLLLGAIQANYTSVNWLGGDHTSDYVELAAMGPGSEAIGDFTRNTDLFDLMVEAAGVRDYASG